METEKGFDYETVGYKELMDLHPAYLSFKLDFQEQLVPRIISDEADCGFMSQRAPRWPTLCGSADHLGRATAVEISDEKAKERSARTSA